MAHELHLATRKVLAEKALSYFEDFINKFLNFTVAHLKNDVITQYSRSAGCIILSIKLCTFIKFAG